MTTRAVRSGPSLLLAAFLLALPVHAPAQATAPAPAPAPVSPRPAPAAVETIEQLPPVVVIDSTPVPGLGIPVEKYPGNVQSVPPGDIDTVISRFDAAVGEASDKLCINAA